MSSVSVLERPTYTETQASRLLGVAPSTLHYWLEGKKGRGDKRYQPILRTDPQGGHPPVTWAEFIEAAVLKEYRRGLKVPLPELRRFVEVLREDFGVPYPLADQRPYASGRALLWGAQQRARLPTELHLVAAVADDQFVLLPTSELFVRRVEFVNGVAGTYRPHAEPQSPVVCNPQLRYGRPSVQGVSTEVIREHADSGSSREEIAEMFDLPIRDVRFALAYEETRRAA